MLKLIFVKTILQLSNLDSSSVSLLSTPSFIYFFVVLFLLSPHFLDTTSVDHKYVEIKIAQQHSHHLHTLFELLHLTLYTQRA